jgi:hypothetical protein
MTFEEFQKAIKDKSANVLPALEIPETENPIEGIAEPSLDEFLNMLIHLRNIRIGRLSIVRLTTAQNHITATFKPTRILKVFHAIKGKSATTPVYMQFNGDGGTNYCFGGNTSVSKITLSSTDTTSDESGKATIINEANKAKSMFWSQSRWTGLASAAPNLVTGVGGWENTESQVSSITLLPAGLETFAAGSYLIVYGVD